MIDEDEDNDDDDNDFSVPPYPFRKEGNCCRALPPVFSRILATSVYWTGDGACLTRTVTSAVTTLEWCTVVCPICF